MADEQEERKWNHSVAVSALHKALRMGDVETAARAAVYLIHYKTGREAIWRRLLAFPAEDLGDVNVVIGTVALRQAWEVSHEDDHIFLAILALCERVRQSGGKLHRTADELKCAALYWKQSGQLGDPPDYAFDVHLGEGTLQDWWDSVNALADKPSPWRDDAMRYEYKSKKAKAKDKKEKEQPKLL